jgi:hypothetical protein
VAFLARSSLLTGGMLAMVAVADALRDRGWDAHVCVLDPRDSDMYDADRAFHVFDGEPDLRRSFREEVFPEGLVVSGSWVTCDMGERLAAEPGLRHVLFEQDDERRFEHNRPEPHRQRIEAAWRDGDVLAVSGWVADAVASVRGSRPDVVRVGYDPLVWHPRPDPSRAPGGPLRVAAMYRPETAHRGSGDVVASLLAASRAGADLEVTLYGSRPPSSLGLPHVYAGRLPHHLLAPAVARCDVLVDLSRFQGFGLDAVQALASGLALVHTRNGGSAEYADPSCCLEADGVPAAAEALLRLSRDRVLLAGMRAAAPAAVRALSYPELADEWEEALLRRL